MSARMMTPETPYHSRIGYAHPRGTTRWALRPSLGQSQNTSTLLPYLSCGADR